MNPIRNLLRKKCINCNARLEPYQMRLLQNRLEMQFRPQSGLSKAGFVLVYKAPLQDTAHCRSCLMEQGVSRANRIWAEVWFWGLGLAAVLVIVLILFSILPDAPPPVDLGTQVENYIATRQRSDPRFASAVILAILGIPVIVMVLLGLRHYSYLFLRLEPRPLDRPTGVRGLE